MLAETLPKTILQIEWSEIGTATVSVRLFFELFCQLVDKKLILKYLFCKTISRLKISCLHVHLAYIIWKESLQIRNKLRYYSLENTQLPTLKWLHWCSMMLNHWSFVWNTSRQGRCEIALSGAHRANKKLIELGNLGARWSMGPQWAHLHCN